ncbi:MAG: transglycosylase SLT domain-containing protein [Acidobacteriaceae bacterium]
MNAPKPSAALVCAALLLMAGCNEQAAKSPMAKTRQATAPTLTQHAPPHPTLASKGAQSSTQPSTTPAAPREQYVIDAAERAYTSGVQHYRAGDLQAAKADFDTAVDTMLTSGLDLKNNPQLNDEFEHIVDAVNTLEMDALKQGNGFAPRTEEAPVDVANDVTFPVDPNVKAAAEAELKTTQSDLPLVINDPVASFIGYFSDTSKGHGTIVSSLRRAGRYKEMIQRILREEGVPEDLIYQAIAESGFQAQALNARSGAAGMWQFMPYNGAYGLARDGWVDERFDPEKATHAYAREIKKNYNQLGDWYLAMAAYDWGAGNVQKAVQRTGYADFWELYRRNNLPLETKNYVPIILAAAIMAKNPARYGLTDLNPDPPVVEDTVTTHGAVDLRLVGDIVGAPVQEIAGLNPSLLRMTTPPDDTYSLHLPPGTKDLYTAAIAEIPESKRTTWRYHRVLPGETLDGVARTYRVTPADLAFVNQLEPSASLDGEDALVIPVAAAASTARNTRYRVEREDTLVTVADRFNVTTAQLRRWNHLRSSAIRRGQTLYVAEPAHIAARTSRTHGRGSKHSRGTHSAKTSARGATASHKSTHATSGKK